MNNKIILMLVLFVTFCSKPENKKINIVTGIAPVSSMIQEIVGDSMSVTNIIPVDVDPHSFQLTGSSARLIANADIVVAIDAHIDAYVINIDNAKESVFMLNESVDVEHSHEGHDHSHEGHDHENNSHLWLSYVHTEDLAVKSLEILTNQFPEHTDLFVKNTDAFITRLADNYRKNFEINKEQVYAVQRHAAWNYLLEELNIVDLGVIEEHEGGTASLSKLADLVVKIESLPAEARIVYIDDAFTQESTALSQLATEVGGEVLHFNPMVTPDGSSDIVNLLNFYSIELLQ